MRSTVEPAPRFTASAWRPLVSSAVFTTHHSGPCSSGEGQRIAFRQWSVRKRTPAPFCPNTDSV
jgi:hypothetical protein